MELSKLRIQIDGNPDQGYNVWVNKELECELFRNCKTKKEALKYAIKLQKQLHKIKIQIGY